MFKKIFLFSWEILKLVVIALVIIVPVRYFLIQPFYVKGSSMEPNFHDLEYLIIDELSFRFRAIERGEVVVFRYPRDPQEFFIKRVIGLPGDEVQIKDEAVYIYNTDHPDGLKLNEPYLSANEPIEANNDNKVKVEDGEYYVMGDNRDASQDSRSFGVVKKSFVIGRVWLRGFPISKATIFTKNKLPKY